MLRLSSAAAAAVVGATAMTTALGGWRGGPLEPRGGGGGGAGAGAGLGLGMGLGGGARGPALCVSAADIVMRPCNAASGGGGGAAGVEGGEGTTEGAVATSTSRRAAAAAAAAAASAPITEEFVRQIPKTDLHVHLDGSVRLETLVELARRFDVTLPSYDVDFLRRYVFKDQYESLEEYLRGFAYTVAVMQHPEALERIAYEFAVDCFKENVHYFEVRFAPQLFACPVGHNSSPSRLSVVEVLQHVNIGLQRARDEFNNAQSVQDGSRPPFEYGIIVCGLRFFDENSSPYYKEFKDVHEDEDDTRLYGLASTAAVHAALRARDEFDIPVVAFDIAGAEAGFPASQHAEAFMLAHKSFMPKTVHAGEAWGPESIFQAITDLHADRIGHGYHIFSKDRLSGCIFDADEFIEQLVKYITNRRIMLEVCLTSNMGTMPWLRHNLSSHALCAMLSHGMSLALCTDNRLMSNTDSTKEHVLAVNTFHLTPQQLRTIVLEGFKRSFFPGTYPEKQAFLDRIFDYYDALEEEHGIVRDHRYGPEDR